jgi:predicted DNA-binding transcriptional regulator YafY
MRGMISRAMHQCDDWVIEMTYKNARGELVRRVVSPIRFVGPDRFLGLCLCREEPRQFYVNRCGNMKLKRAENYIMPVEMVTL